MTEEFQEAALRAPQSIGVACPDFATGEAIPAQYSGIGDDVSPPLRFTGIPRGAQSLAIVLDDPDAPGGTFTHWTVWNVRVGTQLERDADVRALGGVEGANGFGRAGYGGPNPPEGTHRYRFRVLALDKTLGLRPNAPPEDVWRALQGHVLAWGELVGTFTRYAEGESGPQATPGGRYGTAPPDAPHLDPEIAPRGAEAALNVPDAIPGALPENAARRLGQQQGDLA